LDIKKTFLLGAALIVTASPFGLIEVASAAGPTVAPNTWAGAYGGIAGGYGWGQSGQTDSGIPQGGSGGSTGAGSGGSFSFDGSYSLNGGILGGTLGYDWQQGPWVLGVEGDYSWSDISGSSNVCGAASGIPHSCGTKLESFGTLRGRIGYAVGATRDWLPYVTGGLAVGELHAWDAYTPASNTDFRAGWTIGGGVETTITHNWTLKLEYLYVDLGKGQMFDVVPGLPETVSFTSNIIRAGINYKFY
jgi:opacity protein-like surface antigen